MPVRFAPGEVKYNGQHTLNQAPKKDNSQYKVTLGVKPGYTLTEWNLTGWLGLDVPMVVENNNEIYYNRLYAKST